ncbi:MAG: FtsQ-type POTRA domain-containing protein [Ruminococcaceae bacterium]|nr:FtsQ-type POTRA domain-containing protein [Oscillospiraceae bacterium]
MTDRYEGKRRVPREYEDVLYVYDRVCPKQSKRRQMSRTYGTSEFSDVHRHSNPNRVYGKAFAESQRMRAEAYKKASAARERNYGSPNMKSTRGANAHAYSYRPGRAEGGEAVRERPFKLFIANIVNLFESIEERGKADERIAKQRAIARKKFSEYRHTITTALILILITALFVTFVYKTFFVIKDVGATGSEIYSSDMLVSSSGIDLGQTLYSFKSSDAAEEIIFRCPYIKSAEINRTVPNKVSITVEDDSAAYIAKIWDSYILLSSGLRVLEVLDKKIESDDLIELILPPVDYSVGGRVIEFEDQRDDRFIRNILGEVGISSLGEFGYIDKIDLSNEYGITLQVSGKYLMKLGDESDCDLKLRMAYKTITDEQFDSDTPANIDLSTVGVASVMYDLKLSFD